MLKFVNIIGRSELLPVSEDFSFWGTNWTDAKMSGRFQDKSLDKKSDISIVVFR